MRKLMILLLAASAAAPALARPDDDDNERPARPQRSETNRPARAERSENAPMRMERVQTVDRVQAVDHAQPRVVDRPRRTQEMSEQRLPWGGGSPVFRRPERPSSDSVRNSRPQERSPEAATAAPAEPTSRGWTQQPRDGDIADRRFRRALDRRFGDRDDRVRGEQPNDGVWNEHVRDRLAVSHVPRPGTQPPLRAHHDGRRWDSRWSRHWRDDHRYDWRRHRDRNRSRFHIGFYYDPFGWNYQRYQPGWRMWPSYYSRSHWLSNPWHYRLPAAYPGTQWIRYHGDAILIDTWSGEVIDVIHGFFW